LLKNRQDIQRKISSLHSEWDGSFEHIDKIETNTVDTAQVSDLASTIDDLQETQAELETSIDSAQSRKQELKAELKEMEEEHEETREVTVPKRNPAIVAGLALAVGTGVGFVATPIGGGIAGLIILAVGLYTIDSTVTINTTVDADPYRETKAQITTLDGDIQADSDQLSKLDDELKTKQAELTKVVTELGIPEELPTSDVPAFYEQVVELDTEIETYRKERSDWETNKQEFVADLEEVRTVLEDVTDVSWTTDEPLEDADELLAMLNTVASDLELAQDVQRAERERTIRL